MRYRVTHRTEYRYSEPVDSGYNEARLLPRALERQQVLSSSLSVDPPAAEQRERADYFGNRVVAFTLDRPHRSLTVTSCSDVIVEPRVEGLDLFAGESWEQARGALREATDAEGLLARDLSLASPLVPLGAELSAYAEPSFARGRPLLDAVHDLMVRIHRDFRYDPAFTTLSTPLADVLAHRRGVCQDFAHLAIGCLRSQGLAARYVSGYIETLPPPGQPRLVGADASHAWFAVFVPGCGWVDFDPTNNQLPESRHVTVAWGRDYADVTPLKGVIFGGGQMQLSVAVDVVDLDAPPVPQVAAAASPS